MLCFEWVLLANVTSVLLLLADVVNYLCLRTVLSFVFWYRNKLTHQETGGMLEFNTTIQLRPWNIKRLKKIYSKFNFYIGISYLCHIWLTPNTINNSHSLWAVICVPEQQSGHLIKRFNWKSKTFSFIFSTVIGNIELRRIIVVIFFFYILLHRKFSYWVFKFYDISRNTPVYIWICLHNQWNIQNLIKNFVNKGNFKWIFALKIN